MQIYIPDNTDEQKALLRTTHLAIMAHHDDIEIAAYEGILNSFKHDDCHFTGVVVTDGAGSPRSGIYKNYSDTEMMKLRIEEQKKAAYVGDYSAQVFLNYPSANVKSNFDVIADIKTIVDATRPDYIYTHNLADKHKTHTAVAVRVIQALRELDYMPKFLYGCEVWRSLDWLEDKVRLDVSGSSNLENALLGVFDSQIRGGKRYDLAAAGRRLANATYDESHSVDDTSALIYAMDLMPLLGDKALDIAEFAVGHIDKFKACVLNDLRKYI